MSVRHAAAVALLSLGATGGCTASTSPKAAHPEPAANAKTGKSRVQHDIRRALARSDDYVVRVVAGSVTCTGTLIDDDLVLTAHHCISARDDYGDIVEDDVEPETIAIELGGDYFAWGEVGVRAIVAPPCGYAAGHGDIAVLVLERKLVGVETRPPRLDGAPRADEEVKPIGFGRCALSHDGVRRKQREGGLIEDVHDARFYAKAAICPGDSGGPVVSGAVDGPGSEVVGVISRSVMDASESTRGRSEFTRLDHWRPVFANAKQIAAGAIPAELPPIDGCEG